MFGGDDQHTGTLSSVFADARRQAETHLLRAHSDESCDCSPLALSHLGEATERRVGNARMPRVSEQWETWVISMVEAAHRSRRKTAATRRQRWPGGIHV